MLRLTVSLFGGFHCDIAGVQVAGLETHKCRELFSYLVLNRARLHHRDALATLLWGDRAEAQARKGLRQALWLLQTALHHTPLCIKEAGLVVDGDWIGFVPDAAIVVDAEVFAATYRQVQQHGAAPTSADEVAQVRTAVALYKGDLLEGWYQDWCILERERYQFFYLCLLDHLLAYCEAMGDYEGGVICGMQILQCDNARESTHRRLMRLHYCMGHRTRALHQYAACVAALREGLGVAPARSTQQLYAQICNDELDSPATALPDSPNQAPTADLWYELHQIRAALEALAQQVEHLRAGVG